MSKLKVYMSEGWYTYRFSHTIEIDTDDYEELKGMSDEEAYEYLSENMWDFEMKKEKGEKYFKKNKMLSDKQFDCLINWHKDKTNKDEKDIKKNT